MLTSYLKVIYRNMYHQKIYSITNIAGLSVSIACVILIMLWVQDELSYDTFHKNSDTLFRVIHHKDNFEDKAAGTPAPLGPALLADIPEVVNFVRIASPFPRITVKYEDKLFYENRLIFVDSTFFEMFTFPFKSGNSETALKELQNVVITEDIAHKYFGNENPIGKTLLLDGRAEIIVSGVVYNVPHNSHIQFDFLLSFQNMYVRRMVGTEWGDFNFNTYVQLNTGTSTESINKKATAVAISNDCPQIKYGNRSISFQPLTDVHLDAETELAGIEIMAALGNKNTVYVFSLIALLLLCIAYFNYINLSTARLSNRRFEIGVRKTLGASRRHVVSQFITEAVIFSFIALLLSFILVELAFGVFNNFTDKSLSLHLLGITNILFIIALTILVAALAGLFPAFYIFSFSSKLYGGGSGISKEIKTSPLRKALVVVQFSFTIGLIAGVIVIHNQMKFISDKNLGFDKDNIVMVPVREKFGANYNSIKNRLLHEPNILGVAAQDWLQIRGPRNTGVFNYDRKGDHALTMISHAQIDYDFIDVMNIKLAEGRKFSKEHVTDPDEAFIINREAAQRMGLESPVGGQFSLYNKSGRIIGIMEDTHFSTLHYKTEPMVYHIMNDINRSAYLYGSIFIKIKGTDISESISVINEIWREENPYSPFEYQFLDEALNIRYKTEQTTGNLLNTFSFLAIFISCLGLFGLVSFSIEQRTKEIGIRKVLGSNVPGILSVVLKDFIYLILIANIIAWPAAYFLLDKWLQHFAYKIEISWWVFALAGVIALVIALLTVSFQAVKAAMANPVESLRYE
jgi:putative ABC transport system permease protein